MTGIQAWRFGGFAFLALYAQGLLPGLFAWPAGLGDMAVGVTAPWIARALTLRPGFPSSRAFVTWNLLGILDRVAAVGTGILASGLAVGLAGQVTTAPMVQLPLVLVPCYLVPGFVMLHLVAIFQSRGRATISSRGSESEGWRGRTGFEIGAAPTKERPSEHLTVPQLAPESARATSGLYLGALA